MRIFSELRDTTGILAEDEITTVCEERLQPPRKVHKVTENEYAYPANNNEPGTEIGV